MPSSFRQYTKEGFRLAKPQTGNRKMTVAGVSGAGGKYIIKVPVELLGSPREFGFTVVTAKPGATGETQACDVSTMGAVSAEDGLISGSHQVKLAELDGGSSSIAFCEAIVPAKAFPAYRPPPLFQSATAAEPSRPPLSLPMAMVHLD